MLKTFRNVILLFVFTFPSVLIPANAIAAAGDLWVLGQDEGPSSAYWIHRLAPDGTSYGFVSLEQPGSMAFDRLGNLFVASLTTGEVAKFSPDGIRTVVATGQRIPAALCFDSLGNLYVANAGTGRLGYPDQSDGAIIKITPEGIQSVFASNLNHPASLAFDRFGNLFVTDTLLQSILKITPDGIVSPFTSEVNIPAVIAFDDAGILYETDFGSGNVYKFDPDGTRTLFVADVTQPSGLLLDHMGNVFFTDGYRNIYKVAPGAPPGIFAPGATGYRFLAFEPSRGRPLNIATRVSVLTGNKASIAGFIIGGNDPKRVLIRGIGPSLASNHVTGALADPTLELRDSTGALITSNNDWKIDDGTGTSQQATIEATGMPPGSDLEAAIVTTLPSNNSAYTAILRGKDNTTGVGLVEVYDLDQAGNAKLRNISTRGFAENSAPLIGGFIVGENGATILVRAIGPSLGAAGVEGTLSDPRVDLYDSNGAVIAGNDNWRTTQRAEIEASGLPPGDDFEAAVLAVLPTGAYTAVISGPGSGVASVEMYNLN